MKSLFFLSIIMFFSSCDFIEKNFSISEKAEPKTKEEGKIYYENGNLKSACQTDSLKRRHGLCTSYYETGKVKSKITYNHGEKILGISHYENGQPAYEISYKNGMKNGLRKRFFENGKIASEFYYKNDKPGIGLIEYSKSGRVLKNYPELKIVPIDLISSHGKYVLEIYFSKNANRGEYYIGELNEGKYLITSPNLARLSDVNGKVRYEFSVPKGMFLMEKLNFIGLFKTNRNNPYIVEKSFNLAVDNPY